MSNQPFHPKTPQNFFIQLQQQAPSIKAFLKRRSKSPPSPTNQALNQLVKDCKIAMNSAIFLAHENGQLRAAYEKQKQKRTQSNRRIPNEGGVTIQECQEAIQSPVEAVEPPRSPLTRPPTRPILPPPPVRRKLPSVVNVGRKGIDQAIALRDNFINIMVFVWLKMHLK